MPKSKLVVTIVLLLSGLFFTPAYAVVVDYTVTFTGTDGTRGNGTGILAIDETIPLTSFSENSYGDFVNFRSTISGLTFNFSSSDLAVNLGTNQTFYSLSTPSNPSAGPQTSGPNGTEILVLGGVGTFNITNIGAANLDDGTFTIGAGTIAATPLPSTWTMMLGGLLVVGFIVSRRGQLRTLVQACVP